MARPQILIVAVLLTVYVESTKATSLIPENGQWEQNPEAEMKLWKCVKKWSNRTSTATCRNASCFTTKDASPLSPDTVHVMIAVGFNL